MQAAYAKHYKRLCLEHWWWRGRLASVLAPLAKEAARKTDNSLQILDVGCADGVYFDHFGQYGQVSGLEPDDAIYSGENPKVFNLTLNDYQTRELFDVILMLDVLEHIEDDQGSIDKIHSMLSAGGSLILTVPAHQWLWTRHDQLNQHCRRYAKPAITRLFDPALWQIEKTSYLFASLVLPKLMTRLLERFNDATPATPGVPNAWLNTLATTLLSLERRVFSIIPAPFGSSILMVARRK